MAEAQYSPNHTIDPETGYLESNAYPYAFTAERKKNFIKTLVDNGLSIYLACEQLGISHHTLFKHFHNDPVFKQDLEAARNEYADRLDGISKRNALNPKSVIERIFQLKSLFPEKYSDQKNTGTVNVSINLDGKLIEMMKKRDEIIDIEPITSTLPLATESTSLQSQGTTQQVTPVE